jgi:nucleoside-diphosphate-sugar epimerase
MSRDLVTGAAGLIGFELTRQLLEEGREVVAVDRFLKHDRRDLEALARDHPGRLAIVEGDLAHPEPLSGLDGAFDAVYHLAAIVGVAEVVERPYRTISANLRSTLNVIDHAVRSRVRLVLFASSSEAYAGAVGRGWIRLPTPEDVPLVVHDVRAPRWSYAASKIAGESALFGAAAEHGFGAIVLRFHNVYGPRMALTHVIPEMVDRCLRRVDPFPVYGPDDTRSFLYVEDAARAVRCIRDKAGAGRGGIFNVGSSDEIVIGDLAELIFDACGFRPAVVRKPAPPGSVARRVPDVSALSRFGFAPRVGLADGVRRTVEAQRRARARGAPCLEAAGS